MKTPDTQNRSAKARQELVFALAQDGVRGRKPSQSHPLTFTETTKGGVWCLRAEDTQVQALARDVVPLMPVVTHHGQGRHAFWSRMGYVRHAWEVRHNVAGGTDGEEWVRRF